MNYKLSQETSRTAAHANITINIQTAAYTKLLSALENSSGFPRAIISLQPI